MTKATSPVSKSKPSHLTSTEATAPQASAIRKRTHHEQMQANAHPIDSEQASVVASNDSQKASAKSLPQKSLNLSLPERFNATTTIPLSEAAKHQIGARHFSSSETMLSRGIAAAAVPDCLRSQGDIAKLHSGVATKGGLGGLFALPGLVVAAANGKCNF